MNITKIYAEEILFMNITKSSKRTSNILNQCPNGQSLAFLAPFQDGVIAKNKISFRTMCLYLGTILLNVLRAK